MILFFGQSGVGKTAFMSSICKMSNLVYMPVFTVTRLMRKSDDPDYFEYVSIPEYLQARAENKFILDMDNQNMFYGYRKQKLIFDDKISLMYGSPFALESIKQFDCLKVLIEGNPEIGMRLRGDSPDEIQRRLTINSELNLRFYLQEWFRTQMNIIFFNSFCEIERLTENLLKIINEQLVKGMV